MSKEVKIELTKTRGELAAMVVTLSRLLSAPARGADEGTTLSYEIEKEMSEKQILSLIQPAIGAFVSKIIIDGREAE